MTEKKRTLTVSELASLYGCCGLFDPCASDALMALSFTGTEPFLDWLTWEGSDVCLLKQNFISWVRAERYQNAATPGYLADPCETPYGVEWGACDFTLDGFGRLRRASPVRDITTVGLRYCPTQPKYRLDDVVISSDLEFDMRLATEVLLQDLKRLIITGNASVGGQFDGLAQLVATGYKNSNGHTCKAMDSIVVDWGQKIGDLTDGTNQAWNGNAIAAGFSFFHVLQAVYRRIRQRISWSPSLAAQRMVEGDMVLVMPSFLVPCLLDAFTCWRVCDGDTSFNVSVTVNTYEARQFREGLNGGMFGSGQITLDGFVIPIIAYDWGTISGPTHGDIYLLTGKVGTTRLLGGQYNDFNSDITRTELGRMPGEYIVTDGGRLLTWTVAEHTCVYRATEMQPRLLCWAPWAQARIQDVACAGPADVLSPDPEDTSFFIETSFIKAECP